ncbi:MAG: hypothetical protein J7507_08590 [Pseudoxanthomonas sp.]|nr:hypothetical protein [Pseudoxanthomonas sp.]
MSATPPRSTFVTVLAWIFIVMSGMGTLVSILQNVMIHLMLRDAALDQALQAAPENVPAVLVFLAGHARLVFVGFFLVTLFTLASSIGLLRRYNWARWCFIGVMGLGIAWQLAGLAIQSSLLATVRGQFAQAAQMGGPDMGAMVAVIAVVGAIFAAGMIVLHAWLILRLVSPRVAAEFR